MSIPPIFVTTAAQQVSSAALVVTVVVTFWRGDRPEEWGAAIAVVASILTPLVERRESWYQPQWGIFAVDLLTFMALVGLAFLYNKRWPICAAGFQMIGVLTHIAFLISPHALYRGYFYANFAVSYLVLGSLLGGIAVERGSPQGFNLRFLSRLRSATRL